MRNSLLCVITLFMTASLCAVAQGPVLVTDIHPSTDESVGLFNGRATLNDIVYFNGNDGTGYDLWRTDGTAAGTYRVLDLPGTPTTGGAGNIVERGGNLFVSVNRDAWISDGTSAGTFALASPTHNKMSKYVNNYIAMGDHAYFLYYFIEIKPNMTTNVIYELWGTDGTSAGTSLVYTQNWIRDMVSDGSQLFMLAIDVAGSKGTGEEPWRSDGTTAGTSIILDVCQPGLGGCAGSYTATTLNSNFYSSKKYPLPVGSHFYFSKADGYNGEELWRSDGTATGTIRLTDINYGNGHACPQFLTEMDGSLYFTADDGEHGMELYAYPLPNGPASLVKDIELGSGGSEPIWLTPMDGVLYFSAWTSENGRELWRTDGTAANTYRISDIAFGSLSSNPNYDRYKEWYDPGGVSWRQMTTLNGKLYFAADDGNGYELYESDGSLQGTVLLADINPVSGQGSSPQYLTVLGDRLLFKAYHPSYGNEWWVYGTTGNQPPVVSLSVSPESGNAPLAVSFSSSGTIDLDGLITSYFWDFGDGNSASSANPDHTYQNPGSYTATLTVTDDDYAQASADVLVTVTSSFISMHVESQTVTKLHPRVKKYLAEDVVMIHDVFDQPVGGATVMASYYGPSSGTVSGVTDATGSVALESEGIKDFTNEQWCFTVTDVQKTGFLFDPTQGDVGPVCSGSSPKAMAATAPVLTLEQNAPNPFGTGSRSGIASTKIRFHLAREEAVTLTVFDVLGRPVARPVNSRVSAGMHTIWFEAGELSPGLYWYRIQAGEEQITRRMVLLR